MLIKHILPRFSDFGLLSFLIFFFIVAPFFSEGAYARLFLDLSVVSLLILSVYLCSNNKHYVIITLILALPSLARFLYFDVMVDEVTLLFNAGFFIFVIYVLLSRIFNTTQVTRDVIYAAISVYLLIGVFCGVVYTLLESFYPGSFSVSHELAANESFFDSYGQDLIYFSLISMTTVGFGDIVPLSQPAKSLAALEAMTGQVYLTVLVARLVGMHISQSR